MLKIKNLLITSTGIIAVISFILLGFYGGYFDSINIFLFRELSYSISPYAPQNNITIMLYEITNLSILLFSFFLYIRLSNLLAKLGSFFLSLAAVVGMILVEIPM